jgi:uncharacterized repeat protein (TIGR01451 family)
MKSSIFVVVLAAGFLLSGCGEFGKGAPSYNSTWENTFGRGTPTPTPTPTPAPAPAPQSIEHAVPHQPPRPDTKPSPIKMPIRKSNSIIDWEKLAGRGLPAHPPQRSDAGINLVSRSYPCDGGILRLDKAIPEQVQINAPFEYGIKVTNETRNEVGSVVVREHLADNLKVLGSFPQALIEYNTLAWPLGSIPAQSSKEIRIKGVATTMTRIAQCATMTFGSPVCVTADVVEPELLLIKVLPDEALVCDTIPMRIGLKNIGSGVAENAVISDILPAGIESVNGETKLDIDVGTLEAGQAREFTINLKAARPGKYQNMATATASNAATTESALVGVTVGQPVLEISKAGPSKRRLETPLRYKITVTNSGNVSAQDLLLEDGIPSGMIPIKTNYGGKENNGKMVWNLPTLAPHQSLVVEVVYKALDEGTYTSKTLVRASCADPVSATTETVVEGIAAILLEVIDVEDPIELGGYETYFITTTCQGTSGSTNVHIACELEENVKYASAKGPTQATVQGRTISFAPLARLAPRARATWKVVVRAVEAGDVRFKVTLNTDQLHRPVEETESTEIYE